MKSWVIKNEQGMDTAEMLLHGPITDEESWWGQSVGASNLAEELMKLNGKSLTVRINSYGGSVFGGHSIMNALRHYNGDVTAIIDGIAASAAVLVALGADKIIMPSNSMMMIHNPAISLSGSYEAGEMAQFNKVLNQIKSSILAAYKTRSTLSEDKLAELMDQETWMTAETAKEYGFADEISGSVSFELTNDSLLANGIPLLKNQLPAGAQLLNLVNATPHTFGKEDMTNMDKHPNFSMEEFLNGAKKFFLNLQESDSQGKTEKGSGFVNNAENIQPITADFLKANHLEIYNAILNEGAEAERKRIQEIENISSSLPVEMVNKAKFETPKNAKELAFEALQNDSEAGGNLLAALKNETNNSGADGVVAGAGAQNQTDQSKRDSLVNMLAQAGGAK